MAQWAAVVVKMPIVAPRRNSVALRSPGRLQRGLAHHQWFCWRRTRAAGKAFVINSASDGARAITQSMAVARRGTSTAAQAANSTTARTVTTSDGGILYDGKGDGSKKSNIRAATLNEENSARDGVVGLNGDMEESALVNGGNSVYDSVSQENTVGHTKAVRTCNGQNEE